MVTERQEQEQNYRRYVHEIETLAAAAPPGSSPPPLTFEQWRSFGIDPDRV